MDAIDLYNQLDQKTHLLDVAVRELRQRGTAYAQAERDYRVAKAKAILREREKGTAATITLDLVKGDHEVSRLCFERDCAEVLYRSALEAINATKLTIRVLENQISREWGQSQSL